MISVIKVFVTLVLVVVLLHRKFGIGNSMLAGAGLLFIMCSPQITTLQLAVKGLLLSGSTWEILFALYLVMCVEYQLRTHGIIDGLMEAARVLLKSDKVLLALMPAFLGFLPSLGGAVFSAPLVEAAARQYAVSPEQKAGINYWFRHLFECVNPIMPALLLAAQIVQIPVGVLIVHMLWVPVFCLIVGWLYYIAPLKRQEEARVSHIAAQSKRSGIGAIAMATGPILVNFILVVAFGFGPALSMLVAVAGMILLLRQTPDGIFSMLKHALDKKLLWGIICILFFQQILTHSGIIAEVAHVLQNSGIPLMIVIGLIAFLVGILVGTGQGFVAITFPLVAAISKGNVNIAAAAFVAGFAGQMLSPAHLCLLVSLDYYKGDFLSAMKPITLLTGTLLLVWFIVL
ncbi:DUF401 family protein [Acetonema longum]|uniref:DUF401 family protein n=1 Tax=Acetonema longum DSM 6540 TaxID=1009370 RepID=F7NFE2_9FIRM|nr:DUF401 family protein [Acetonema longum]EGO65267.1 hypothetical protein ALO_03846 [Acetonema longum DSM 6540]